jgi:multiple sugar transport system substrate-binding protein
VKTDKGFGGLRRFSRREFLGFGAASGVGLLLAGCSGGQQGGSGTLNALFMKQAAYSEGNVRSMTKEFQNRNPDIKVNLTFVAYEAILD